MQSYENGSSTVCKEDNWGQLATFFFKKDLAWQLPRQTPKIQAGRKAVRLWG